MTIPKDWKIVRIGDVCNVIPGYAFKSKNWQETGIPVIRIKNIQDNRSVDTQDCMYVPRNILTDRLQRFVLKDGDILIAMTGATAGKVGRIRGEGLFLLNQRVAKIEPVGAEYGYLWPLLSSDEYRRRFFHLADGAAQPNMSGKQIEYLEIPFPPRPIQQKIAAILSTYDDLIENNLRRIKILEEMAQNLYREWFVKFRFPGHEKVRMVDSPLGKIPEGWELKRLGEVVELAYGKALKKSDRKNGSIPVYGSSGVVGFHDKALVTGPGIIVGRKGNVGSVFWSYEDFYPIDTVYFVRTELPQHFVYYNLQQQNFINNDAAVPGLNRNQAYSLPFLVPSDAVIEEFSHFVEPLFSHTKNLRAKNENLCQTRDLLLPKLISGDLDVSELDIQSEVA